MPETILPMIPDVPADATPRQRPFLASLKEIIEVREQRRGDPLDGLVSFRDLRDVIVNDETIVTLLGVGHDHTIEHITPMANSRVLGRGSTGSGDAQEMAISSDYGLAFTFTPSSLKINTPQDLQAAASPAFVTVKLSGLTDGYIPYHASDVLGLTDSPILVNEGPPLSLSVAGSIYVDSLIVAASEYVNFGVAQGSSGYGLRDNAGIIESKDSGSSWRSIKEAFPIGAVYLNVTGVNPSIELGYGAWSQIAQEQFLVGMA
jgi:hypothetical protein